jgi:hypothetical protein
MRNAMSYLAVGFIPLLVSCASQRIALAPVGPPPWDGVSSPARDGRLQVFSETREFDDDDVYYFPHSPYSILTMDGKRVKYVWNRRNHEDETPTVVTLPAGQYVVEAEATLYGPVSVPVVIKPGRTTRVVLEPGWKPPGQFGASGLVKMPNGYAIGWRANATSAD